jgi:isopenicillin N synthase-like dioxygenase
MADTEIIPVIDLGPYLAGAPGAIDGTAGELRFALTEIGFYFILNQASLPGRSAKSFGKSRVSTRSRSRRSWRSSSTRTMSVTCH